MPAPDMAAPAENGMTATTHAGNSRYKLPQIAFFDCTDDSWTATSTTDAPDGRIDHTAVWTGSEMIVWGGFNFSPPYFLNTGGRYNPATDSWTAYQHRQRTYWGGFPTAVWTGSEVIVWGGTTTATI